MKKYRRLLAAAVAALLILVSYYGPYSVSQASISSDSKVAWLGILALFINLASTVIAFFIASILFSSEDEAAQEQMIRRIVTDSIADPTLEHLLRKAVAETIGAPKLLSHVHWAELIQNSAEIDFVVQGWDGWFAQQATARALTEFFQDGGSFRLYLCHPTDPAASHARASMETRLGRNPADVVTEITGTQKSVTEIFSQAVDGSTTARLEIFQTTDLNWYFAALFKGRKISGEERARDVMIFSIYSHTPRRPWNMPTAVVYPDLHGDIKMVEWFEAEMAHLRAAARP